jgi:hypothetical protein
MPRRRDGDGEVQMNCPKNSRLLDVTVAAVNTVLLPQGMALVSV